MTIYAGLDVSDKSTHVCVVGDDGGIVWRGACATDPEVLARTLARHARGLARVVLETGALSAFLYHGLIDRGVPVTCVCARHAKRVLQARVNKSDPHDAEGLAQLARTGWFKAVRIKGEATHLVRAQLKIRAQLAGAHRAMANQLRGLLKLFGLRLGQVTTPAKRACRLAALFAQKPELAPILRPLVESLEALEAQIGRATRLLAASAAADPVTARLMSVPGVGPIAALTFKSSIEDPERFARGEDAGAFAGLVPRRQQSGERDTKGRISKAGDPMLRHALYEAAQQPARAGQARVPAAGLGQGARRGQGRQARPRRGRAQTRHPAPPFVALGRRVPLGLTSAARDDRRPRPDDRAYSVAAPTAPGTSAASTHPRLTAIMRHGHHQRQRPSMTPKTTIDHGQHTIQQAKQKQLDNTALN